MTLKRNRPLVTATISVAALSMLAACGTRPSLVDYRPVVDSYNHETIANYKGDPDTMCECRLQAQAEYDRREKEQRQSLATVGFINWRLPVPPWAGLARRVTARSSGPRWARWKAAGETDYDPTTSPRKIVDRCMQNRGYEM